MLGLGLSLQKGISAFNAGRALVSSYIRRVTEAGGVLQNTACDAAAINELNQDRLLEPASWVLVPDGIKEDVVFAQKPTSGLGDLTFTRASDATYTDSTGVVRRSPYNLVTFSEDFSNAAWQKLSASISSNVTTAPNGTLTADTLSVTTTIYSGINQALTQLTGSYTSSIYAKKGTKNWLYIIGVSGSASRAAWFNLDTGVVGTVNAGVTATIQSIGDGWYRCTATDLRSGIGIGYHQIGLSDADSSLTPTSSGTAFIWGAQLVEGTSALDYFPTTNRQDVPRIDFRNADGTLSSCGRLLLEPQRTNVALQSESLNTNPNVVDASTFTANVYISPSGTQSADQLTETTANDKHGFYQYTTVTAQAYTASVFTKQTGRRYISFTSDVTGTQVISFFDLQTKSVLTSASGHTCSVQDYGDGWLRLIVSFTASAGNRFLIWGGSINGTNNTYAGSTSVSQTFWGYQLEAGTYPTTYIPTTTAAVTRIDDVASKTGVSSLIGQTEGTVFAEVNLSAITAERRIISITSGSEIQRIMIWTMGTTLYVNFNGSTVTLGNFPNGSLKIAVGYTISGGNTTYSITTNGGAITTGTFAVSPTGLSKINLGSSAGGGLPLSDRATQAALFPTRLSNDQLEVLTSEGYGTYALLAESLNYVLQ